MIIRFKQSAYCFHQIFGIKVKNTLIQKISRGFLFEWILNSIQDSDLGIINWKIKKITT